MSYGLGKPRSRLGYWLDSKRISQSDLQKMTRLSRVTLTKLCNDNKYHPHINTKITIISALRKANFNVKMSDFW